MTSFRGYYYEIIMTAVECSRVRQMQLVIHRKTLTSWLLGPASGNHVLIRQNSIQSMSCTRVIGMGAFAKELQPDSSRPQIGRLMALLTGCTGGSSLSRRSNPERTSLVGFCGHTWPTRLSSPSSSEFLFLVLSLSPRRLSASAWSFLLPKLHRTNPETLENDQILTTPDNLETLHLDSRLGSRSCITPSLHSSEIRQLTSRREPSTSRHLSSLSTAFSIIWFEVLTVYVRWETLTVSAVANR
ncbi:hypothetical protein PYCCODRAFT_1500831 [Trametes coccinea BRFM310]|uniref:Uncharacterized protein n=1 Tax=Trametes coccinea (strain BRFM310) TaxID=1353009 RepID=A0A1Y2IM44_TRAC3|nr:hypothetical protein PYCCODRAFT_1500831 [Trametes coccinea BRFM310]